MMGCTVSNAGLVSGTIGMPVSARQHKFPTGWAEVMPPSP